jgi:hypothetical protein
MTIVTLQVTAPALKWTGLNFETTVEGTEKTTND